MSDKDVNYNNTNNINLPPGFRFDPTDEELLVQFLHRKTSLLPCHPDVIPDLDLAPFDPWELDGKALNECRRWYFYSRRTKTRITSNGQWKATGNEECVISSCGNRQVGIKKHFMFYVGDASPVGVRTNWILEEFRLSPDHNSASTSRPSKSRSRHKERSKWVICKVYERGSDDSDEGTQLSCMDEVYLSLEDLDEISLPI